MARSLKKRTLFWRLPLSSQTLKYSLRHSINVFALVGLITWLMRTNKSTMLLWCKIYFRALEPLHWRFFHRRAKDSHKSQFLSPQDLYYLFFYSILVKIFLHTITPRDRLMARNYKISITTYIWYVVVVYLMKPPWKPPLFCCGWAWLGWWGWTWLWEDVKIKIDILAAVVVMAHFLP